MKAISASSRSLVRLAVVLCYGGLGVAALAQNPISGVVVGSLPAGGTDLTYVGPGAPLNLGSFGISIVPGGGLAGNAVALAAVQRAANQWAAYISDPITVSINIDLTNLGSPSVIGSTSPVLLQGSYNEIRNAMVADALNEPSNGVVLGLPTAAQFSAFIRAGSSLSGNIVATKANLKAMGFDGAFLDGIAGTVSDATIRFNSSFSFDYDNSDGVAVGAMDFETVAAHEIGHVLGFISAVDQADSSLAALSMEPLDLFRFGQGGNPSSLADFTNFPRDLVPGSTAFFDDLSVEALFSTGRTLGDGRQASHWKDDALTLNYLGMLDPTLNTGTVQQITALDLRALDVIGYEVNAVPETSTNAALLGIGLLGGTWLIRRRARRG